jgi:hypothetical protein
MPLPGAGRVAGGVAGTDAAAGTACGMALLVVVRLTTAFAVMTGFLAARSRCP